MTSTLTGAAVVGAGAFTALVLWAAPAQASAPAVTSAGALGVSTVAADTDPVNSDGNDDTGKWGLMGLIGLGGLFGYRKYLQHRDQRVATTSPATRTH